MEKTALIAGATGLVGSYVLKELLNNPVYTKVTVLVRKSLDVEHPKLDQLLFDFDNPDAEKIVANHVYCCLGTTIGKAGSKPAFIKVDKEYPISLARLAFTNGCETYSIITSVGSNEKSLFFYSRVKGQVETEIRNIPFKSLCILRPSMLLGPRSEYRFGEEIGKIIMKVFGFITPPGARAIHASQVAAAMVYHTINPKEGVNIVDSATMQKFPSTK